VRPKSTPREPTRTKRQPPDAVVLHNDDINGFDSVVGVLRKVFNYGRPKAFWLTLAAHVGGRRRLSASGDVRTVTEQEGFTAAAFDLAITQTAIDRR
jgi:hypothetical protein